MIAVLLAAGTIALTPRFGIEPSVVCKSQGALQTSGPAPALLLRPQDRAAVRAYKLTDLPKANLEYAVVRTVDGCARPAVVRYEFEGDGKFARDDRR
ncbi:MAG: hypothetical protein JWQ29_175 [Phenylobacterium sp.]|nr:hypothetical protein [Phenylobacterium sp.]